MNQVNAQTAAATDLKGPVVENLPAVVVDQPLTRGETVNIDQFTTQERAAVRKTVESFDINNTAASRQFGANGQRKASEYLDKLLADMKADEAGHAGEIIAALSDGIDLMKIDKVRDQLQNPPNGFMRFVTWFASFVGMWTDYVKLFNSKRGFIVDHFAKLGKRADNTITMLNEESGKHDRIRIQTIEQFGELKIAIAAGEEILYNAQQHYDAERQRISGLSHPDPLELSKLRDYRGSVVRFHVRYLKLVEAYVRASSVALEQVRMAQESIGIEIDQIDNAILFDMTEFKRVVLQLATWKKLSDAAADRKRLQRSLAVAQDVLVDATVGGHKAAKESQGDALDAANKLFDHVQRMKAGMEASREAEEVARERRAQAVVVFREAKRIMDEAQIDDLKATASQSVA